jgi:purine nucleosidase
MTGSPPRVVVDCDPGIDDALALLVLAHHHRRGRIQLSAVVAVAGNVPLERTLVNARYVLAEAGLDEVPVVAGAAGPIGEGGKRHATVHGEDGLGGFGPPLDAVFAEPSGAARRSGAADPPAGASAPPSVREGGAPPLVGLLERYGQSSPAQVLAIGPLTDVALALRAAPNLPERVDRLVAMGGALRSSAGNIAPRAEFNFWADPDAAAFVCGGRCRLELVPLDVTEQVVLQADAVAFLEARLGPSSLASRVARAGIELRRRQLGVAHLPLHDPLAAAVLVEPALVGEVETGLSVCLDGTDRGRVQPVDEPPAHRVALSVDVARAEAAILEALVGD